MIALNLTVGRNAPSTPAGEILQSSPQHHFPQHSPLSSKDSINCEHSNASHSTWNNTSIAISDANHRAAHAQAKQIEGAIRLLQMQHDAILSSVLSSQVNALHQQQLGSLSERDRQRIGGAPNPFLGSGNSFTDILSNAAEFSQKVSNPDFSSLPNFVSQGGLHSALGHTDVPAHRPHANQPEQPTFRHQFELPFAPLNLPSSGQDQFCRIQSAVNAPAGGRMDMANSPAYNVFGGPPHRGISSSAAFAGASPQRTASYTHFQPDAGIAGRPPSLPAGFGESDSASAAGAMTGYEGRLPLPHPSAGSFGRHVQSYFDTAPSHLAPAGRLPDVAGSGTAGEMLAHGPLHRKRPAEDALPRPADHRSAQQQPHPPAAAGGSEDFDYGGLGRGGDGGQGRLALAPEVRAIAMTRRSRRCCRRDSQDTAAVAGGTGRGSTGLTRQPRLRLRWLTRVLDT